MSHVTIAFNTAFCHTDFFTIHTEKVDAPSYCRFVSLDP